MNKIQKIKEAICYLKGLTSLELDILDEKTAEMVNKYIKKINNKLQDILKDIEEVEVNKITSNHLKAALWQPIKTAPKDGTKYLGVITGEPFICYYDEDDGHICEHQTELKVHRPLFWMELPKPPLKSMPKQHTPKNNKH